MGDLPITFRENRAFAWVVTVLLLASGLGCASFFVQPSFLATPRAALMPLVAPLLIILSLWGLRWSLPAGLLAPVFLEIRAEGLWHGRFGLIPWTEIGPTVLYRANRNGAIRPLYLRIEVRDLASRVEDLPWPSRWEWRVWGAKYGAATCLNLRGERFDVYPGEVLAALESHRAALASLTADPKAAPS